MGWTWGQKGEMMLSVALDQLDEKMGRNERGAEAPKRHHCEKWLGLQEKRWHDILPIQRCT